MIHDEMYEDDEMYLKHTLSLFTSNRNVALLSFALEHYLKTCFKRQVDAANIIVRPKDSELRVEMFTNEPDFEMPLILATDEAFLEWCQGKLDHKEDS